MSDPKNISPLLDGFQLGAPICEHGGVVCCPAIKENAKKKYILKVISVPASQSQFDAMLLAGAYKDPAEAMEYFRKIGEGILAEAEQLKLLSKMEGFLSYDGWQMEPITRRRLGYEIYLVGSYKRSLEKYIAKHAFTHLEAINLSLDLCSALSVCRQTGYLYVDLKPSNIYISENKQYRIGDLGFLSMDSLRYATLPDRYHSPYTPPELLDPMAEMNLSVDTYPVGMILYRLYNDGHLPFSGNSPTDPLPPPVHADYELAEIIMKAIDPDPEKRWLDPKELGKAIASYMQRNRVNDIPITPFIPLDVTPEVIHDSPEKKLSRRKHARKTAAETAAEPVKQEEASDLPEAEQAPQELPQEPDTVAAEEMPQQIEDTTEVVISHHADAEEGTPKETVGQTVTEGLALEEVPEPVATEELIQVEEGAPLQEEPESETEYNSLSEELMRIIAKADDLIVHDIPEDAIFPAEQPEDPFSFVLEDQEDLDTDVREELLMEEADTAVSAPEAKETGHFVDTTKRKKVLKFFLSIFFTLLLCALLVGGYWFYKNICLQTVESISASATQNQLTVLIDTTADESRLTATCTDSKGKIHSASVKGGKAIFTDLQPSTEYTVELKSSGIYVLTGKTSEVFVTEATTQVLTFIATAGSEDGSALLTFTVDGNEPDFWNIRYSAEGEEEKRETITNHSTMISGLTVGKVYTFKLDGGADFDLSGNTAVDYIAAKLILADNMKAGSDNGTDIWVSWEAPGDVVVQSWTVRCYDSFGFEEQRTVTDTKVQFKGLDPSGDYTVEVTASGMIKPQTMSITANPICITAFKAVESNNNKLDISWEFTGKKPDGGWILNYTIDGSGNQTVDCAKETASISTLIPGATYSFTLQAKDGKTVFNNQYTHTTADAAVFADNNVIPENLSIDLIKTPESDSWTYETLANGAFTDTFALGESAAVVIRSSSTFYLPGYETKVLYVFRNSYGNVLPEYVSEEVYYWKNIWLAGDAKIGELVIPKLPTTPGEYVMELYFNGKTVAKLDMKIIA